MNRDEEWMRLALKQANKAEEEGEVPVGAVLIKDGIVFAQAHNQPISTNDATAHAEIQLLRSAGKLLNNYRLINTTMYITLEPCIMCLGAILNARISKIVFGAYDNKKGACGSHFNLLDETKNNHKPIIVGGILELESKQLLQSFFKSRR